ESDQFYLKSPEEMYRVFGELPETLTNTIRIAEMCDLKLDFTGYHVPRFEVPAGTTGDAYLEQLCQEGLRERYGHCEGAVATRLAHELSVIREMGFTDYFLVVWDFIRFARENGILVGPGRGSAAASIVTYGLGITALDPLEHDLIFERFLNSARITMPDIDIDFADDRRGDVIDYVVQKYGSDHVAQIVTFGTMAAKQSVRDVGRAMSIPVGDTDRVAKLIPVGPGVTIKSALAKVPELANLYEKDSGTRDLLDNARKVEGIARHASTHAAGVVISREPLVRHVPLQRAGGKSEGEITTQYPMDQLESLGLLKMDFLGLRTLTVLGKAVAMLRVGGHEISLESIPLEDEQSYALLRAGHTVGVFQLEGAMTTRMTIDVAPNCFADLVALMALIRPGPMMMAPDYIGRKHGRIPIEYMHPELEPILRETYGVALYQEQIMRIANTLAGFSMPEGDGLRYVMGKKLPLAMATYRERFIEGCLLHGLPAKLTDEIWAMVERFAGYGFNKAHSAAYAVIAAQTAYLKAHHPHEFMAALLSSEIGNTDKIVFNVVECRRAGIDVLPPDVNSSERDFSVTSARDEHAAIRFGLAAVKNVGEGAVLAILESRAGLPNAQFADLHGFCAAIDWERVSRRAVESLARCGALDCFGQRAAVLASLNSSIASARQRQKAIAKGQIGLFSVSENSTTTEYARTLEDAPELSGAIK
ncbi:MAG: DNA polymerase III subunit alpha, partial [Chloroflexota bacterium]|nr:DNA polymerase III subunit alpha [Chloroflexota bacterium]